MNAKLKNIILCLAVVSTILGAASRVAATPLSSSQLILNFDLTGATPAPPYTNITFWAEFAGSDPVTENLDTMLTYVYGDLDGTNLLQVRNDSFPGFSYSVSFSNGGTSYGPLTTANPLFDPMLDGVFSFGLAVPFGSADLVSFSVRGITAQGVTNTVTQTFSVPDNGAMWVLLLGGCLGLALFTRIAPRHRPAAARSR